MRERNSPLDKVESYTVSIIIDSRGVLSNITQCTIPTYPILVSGLILWYVPADSDVLAKRDSFSRQLETERSLSKLDHFTTAVFLREGG